MGLFHDHEERSNMVSKHQGDQVAGAVFLIGLGVLFLTGYWWPGILFVIGASAMARGVSEGQAWYNVPGGLWMIGLGLVFAFGFSWPLLLILIGVSMLFGKQWHGQRDVVDEETRKPKNDDKPKRDTFYVSNEDDQGEITVEDTLG
jgi:hypothetical protein